VAVSLRNVILPALDQIRAIAGLQAFGLRPYVVKRRVRTWTGERPGVGSFTDLDLTMVNTMTLSGSIVSVPVRVKRKTSKDVIASGGLYTDHDFRVGPMTPLYTGGGVGPDDIDPVTSSSATEVFWWMSGPDIVDGGSWFKKVDEEGTALHYYVTLRQTGETHD